MAKPWYHDGLKFTCTRCGNCCTGESGYVWINKKEIQEVSEYLGIPQESFLTRHVRQVGVALSLVEKPNGDCTFYDRQGKGCKIYPVRPRQCRTWPFWDSNLKSEQAWEATCEGCPGAGKGNHHDFVEVEKLRSIIRV